jgi:hypothetical protein
MPRPLRWIGAVALAVLPAGRAFAEEPSAPEIAFLDTEAAARAIVDESAEEYFAVLQPAEMEAKTRGEPLTASGIAAQRDECRERYRSAVRKFSAEEKAAITTLVTRLHGAWAEDYPRIADLPWSFLAVEDRIEGAMPHTRGRHIVIPASHGTSIVSSLQGDEAARRFHLDILAHEQSHVLQRMEPTLFHPLYASWGFQRVEGLQPPEEVLPRHVFNPDGVRTEWIFTLATGRVTTHFLPLVVLRDLERPHRMPDDFDLIAVELIKSEGRFRAKKDGTAVASRSLPSLKEYGDRFGGIFENFHPNEIFSVLFAAMVVKDRFGGDGLPKPSEAAGPDFAKLRAWCKKSLAVEQPAGAR